MDFNKQLKITDPMCFFYRTPYLEIIERMIDKGDRAPRTMFSLDISRLTVALFLGTLVPERSISSIFSPVIMVFKNCPQGLPLKFQGASFGAIKFFWGKIFIGSLTGSEPEITIIIYSCRVF